MFLLYGADIFQRKVASGKGNLIIIDELSVFTCNILSKYPIIYRSELLMGYFYALQIQQVYHAAYGVYYEEFNVKCCRKIDSFGLSSWENRKFLICFAVNRKQKVLCRDGCIIFMDWCGMNKWKRKFKSTDIFHIL